MADCFEFLLSFVYMYILFKHLARHLFSAEVCKSVVLSCSMHVSMHYNVKQTLTCITPSESKPKNVY